MLALLTLLSGCSDRAADGGARPYEAAGVLQLERAPRGLVIISIDTLRRDTIGRFGGTETPNIDRILSEGVSLDNHRSCSNWTYASMLCAYSGFTTDELGFEPLHTESGEPDPLDPGFDLLGRFAGRQGMVSGIVTTNLFLSEEFHTTAGFDYEVFDPTLDAAAVVDAGLELLDTLEAEAPAGGWLLQVHLLDPHDPYAPPDAYLEGLEELPPIDWDLGNFNQLKALEAALPSLDAETLALVEQHLALRYRGLARYVDDELGRLLAELEARGALDDALVMLMTDHGEELLDRGAIGHGQSLFDEETRSAVGFWARDLAPLAWGGPTSHPDLLPTLAAAMGWELEPSFGGQVVGTAAADRALLVHRYSREDTLQSVVRGRYKLLHAWGLGYALYDTAADPLELRDVYAEEPEVVEELEPYLEAQRARIEALYPEAADF